MSDVILVYATMSGNTAFAADFVEEGLLNKGVSVEKADVMDVDSDHLLSHNYIAIGVYTWGDGDVPDDAMDLYEDLEDADLSGKTFILFGTGDTSYPDFCGAVDRFEEVITNQGGRIFSEPLKIEESPEGDDRKQAVRLGESFADIVS